MIGAFNAKYTALFGIEHLTPCCALRPQQIASQLRAIAVYRAALVKT